MPFCIRSGRSASSSDMEGRRRPGGQAIVSHISLMGRTRLFTPIHNRNNIEYKYNDMMQLAPPTPARSGIHPHPNGKTPRQKCEDNTLFSSYKSQTKSSLILSTPKHRNPNSSPPQRYGIQSASVDAKFIGLTAFAIRSMTV